VIARWDLAASAVFAIFLVVAFAQPALDKGSGGGSGSSSGHGSGGTGERGSPGGPCSRTAASQSARSGAAFAPVGFGVAKGAIVSRRLVGGEFLRADGGFLTAGEEAPGSQSSHDSDLGPWIVFLWAARGIAAAARSLALL
jgi:hypothetical protein